MSFKLTKTIPSRKETISFNWIKKDFMNFGVFRKARERLGLPMKSNCFWCHRKFADEDMMAIGSVEKKGNKFFCQNCLSGSERAEG